MAGAKHRRAVNLVSLYLIALQLHSVTASDILNGKTPSAPPHQAWRKAAIDESNRRDESAPHPESGDDEFVVAVRPLVTRRPFEVYRNLKAPGKDSAAAFAGEEDVEEGPTDGQMEEEAPQGGEIETTTDQEEDEEHWGEEPEVEAPIDLSASIPPCTLPLTVLPAALRNFASYGIAYLTDGKWQTLSREDEVSVSCSPMASTLTITLRSSGDGATNSPGSIWRAVKDLIGGKEVIEKVMDLPEICSCPVDSGSRAPPVFALGVNDDGEVDTVMIRCTPPETVEYRFEKDQEALCPLPSELREAREGVDATGTIRAVGPCLYRVLAPSFVALVASRTELAVTSASALDFRTTQVYELEAGDENQRNCQLQHPEALKLFVSSGIYAVDRAPGYPPSYHRGKALYIYTGQGTAEAQGGDEKAANKEPQSVPFRQITKEEYDEIETENKTKKEETTGHP